MSAVPDNTGTTAIGTPTTVTIGTIGENAVRTFTATAGQKLTLTVTRQQHRRVWISRCAIRTATPSRAVRLGGRPRSATCSRCRSTGTYTITVDPRDVLTGSLTFR